MGLEASCEYWKAPEYGWDNMKDTISKKKVQKYLEITSKALGKAKVIAPENSFVADVADDFYDMANRYYSDAEHFYREGDFINAFAAVNYAHGWLDAGARLGIFDVDVDHRLFTLAH